MGSCLMREKHIKYLSLSRSQKLHVPTQSPKQSRIGKVSWKSPPKKSQSELNHAQMKWQFLPVWQDQFVWQFLPVWQDQQHQSSHLKKPQPKVSEVCAYYSMVYLQYTTPLIKWFSVVFSTQQFSPEPALLQGNHAHTHKNSFFKRNFYAPLGAMARSTSLIMTKKGSS